MEACKENSHNCNKTYRYKSYLCCVYCQRCHGLCIFAQPVLNKYPASKPIRKMIDEKYFKNEFAVLRSITSKISPEMEQEPKEPFINDLDESSRETFKLLQKFHNLNQSDKMKVLKAHVGLLWSPLLDQSCKTNKTNKIQHQFLEHNHFRKEIIHQSRQKKRRNLIRNADEIFLL